MGIDVVGDELLSSAIPFCRASRSVSFNFFANVSLSMLTYYLYTNRRRRQSPSFETVELFLQFFESVPVFT